MISKTRMIEHVRGWQWRDVEAGLAEKPDLIRYRNERGRNWLHLCCMVNPKTTVLKPAASLRTADVLMEAGLKVNDPAFREGKWRATPLWHAIGRGRNLALSKHLLACGSDPNHCLFAASYHQDIAAIDLLIANGADIDEVAEDETPFLGTVKNSRFRAAEALLAHGADPNFRDSRGLTALHCMLKKGSDARHFRTLLAHGARTDIPNPDGQTAADIIGRKRSPAFRKLAAELAAR